MKKGSFDKAKWSPQFVYELAISIDEPSKICDDWGVSDEEYASLMRNEVFKAQLDAWTETIKEKGLVMSAKAKLMVEGLLPSLYEKARAVDTPAETSLLILKELSALAGLDKGGDLAPTTVFTVNVPKVDADGKEIQENTLPLEVDLSGD